MMSPPAPNLPQPPAGTEGPKYLQMALRMAQLIEQGAFKAGQRLPSVRDLAAQDGVSMSTVVKAFHWLEERGLAQARPKAGYFALDRQRSAAPSTGRKPALSVASLPAASLPAPLAWGRSTRVRENTTGSPWINFSGACPRQNESFDEDRIRVALARSARVHRRDLVNYSDGVGVESLRQAVARRALHMGCRLDAEHIVITASCMQSVSLCLQAVTTPGGMVAIESPTHFGFLDVLDALGLKAIEIPTHPRTGLSLQALQLALDTQPIQAVLAMPTLSNPLGAVMSTRDKRALVQLLAARGVPLIEDAVFNDLMASDEGRKAAKAFDVGGGVMLCGSFSKTLTPGIRLGWVAGGRWHDRVAALKTMHGAATNAILEHAMADLLTQGGYEARMRKLGRDMADRLKQARDLVRSVFPAGTRVTTPKTGYVLWVELPLGTDTDALADQCCPLGIRFCPGSLFSTTSRYRHCLRLSFAGPWGEVERQGLARIGQLVRPLASGGVGGGDGWGHAPH